MSLNLKKRMYIRAVAALAVLSALSCVLMFLEFSVPLVPMFLKMDFSDLPALVASFAYGPWAGVIVALIKNLVHLPVTTTGGAGELANFLLCACFVVPAGAVYAWVKGKKGALFGALCGTLAMAIVSLPVNYYITYLFKNVDNRRIWISNSIFFYHDTFDYIYVITASIWEF